MTRTWTFLCMYSVWALLNQPLESGVRVFFIIMSPKTGNARVGLGKSFVSNLLNTYIIRQALLQGRCVHELTWFSQKLNEVGYSVIIPIFQMKHLRHKGSTYWRAQSKTRVVLSACDHFLYHIHRLGGTELKSIGPLAEKACKSIPSTSREALRESWKPPVRSTVTHGGKRGSWFREGWRVSETSMNTQRIHEGSENALQCTIMTDTCHSTLVYTHRMDFGC